jgi:molecular chaperone GrpE
MKKDADSDANPETKADPPASDAPSAASDAPPPAEPEDPKVTALKSTIASLEAELSTLQNKLAELQVQTEMNSKNAYLRLASDVDNYKKQQVESGDQNELEERANVIKQFLPVYDALESLSVKYATSADEDAKETQKNYGALQSNLMSTLQDLGLSTFHVDADEDVAPERHEVKEEEFSTTVKSGRVIKEVESGYELEGNIVKKATIIASKGTPEEEAKRKEEEAAKEEPRRNEKKKGKK